MTGTLPRRVRAPNRGRKQKRHEVFMTMTVLEMERQRRVREAQLCREKLVRLEARIEDIDHQVQRMLQDLEGDTSQVRRVDGQVSLRY